ncbi:transposase, partial [Mycobacterium rufum]|nr:transposase [Mycolicibacterium rufum]
VDGRGRPLAVVVTGGQRNDGAMLSQVLEEIVVPRYRGRARSRRCGHRRPGLFQRGHPTISTCTQDHRGHSAEARRDRQPKTRGSAGGRPPALDEIRYKQRNLVERSYALLKQWRGLATRYDKL